jgi:hypothetical protein
LTTLSRIQKLKKSANRKDHQSWRTLDMCKIEF